MTDTTPNPRPIATMMAMPPQPSILVFLSSTARRGQHVLVTIALVKDFAEVGRW